MIGGEDRVGIAASGLDWSLGFCSGTLGRDLID